MRTRPAAPTGSLLVATLLVAALVAGVAAVAVADSGYGLTVNNAIDVPDRTVTVEDREYHVSTLSTYRQGEYIEATVTAPAGEDSRYTVRLYNADRQQETASPTRSGDDTVRFGTDDLPPGSYVLGVDDDGFQVVHPVVVQGYGVSVAVDGTDVTGGSHTVEAGQRFETTVDLEPYEDAPPVHAVEVVLVYDDGTHRTVTASEAGSNSYAATVDAPEEAGSYRLGVTVRGPEEVADQDEREVVAVGDPVDLEVTAGSTPTATPDDASDGSSSASGDAGSDTPTATTATPTPGVTPTTEPGPDGPTPTPGGPDGDAGATTPSPTDGGPITPDEYRPDVAGESQAGFGAAVASVALLLLALLARRPR